MKTVRRETLLRRMAGGWNLAGWKWALGLALHTDDDALEIVGRAIARHMRPPTACHSLRDSRFSSTISLAFWCTMFGSQGSLAVLAFSRLLGWLYTLAWSLSFYPQVIHNHTARSTRGLSSDFVALNAVGHASYLAYNTLLLYYGPVRKAYRRTHDGRDNVVQFNDFAFSLHATLLALITLAQYLRYRKTDQHISRPVRLGLAAALTAGVFMAGAKRLKLVGWLDIVNAFSTLKLAVTLTKYIPQLKLNRDRKSTSGFTIENVLLDLTGGTLSLAQLVLDAVVIQGSWSGVGGDWGKLGLGLLSCAFDAALMYQHYILYPQNQSPAQHQASESDPLLPSSSR